MKGGGPVVREEEGEGHRGYDLVEQAEGVTQCRKRCWGPKKGEHRAVRRWVDLSPGAV